MPTILTFDTTTEVCSVALQHDARIFSRCSDTPNSHAKVVLPLVQEVLDEAGLELKAVDGLGVTIGPGSFTGIRIGVSIAQGLSFGSSLPVVTVTTLELLAHQSVAVANGCGSDIILVALDARMGEVYWQLFQINGNDLSELSPPAISDVATFNTCLGTQKNIVGVGHGWLIEGVDDSHLVRKDGLLKPSADFMIPLVENRLVKKVHITAESLEPLYLRNEITWQKRTRIRNK